MDSVTGLYYQLANKELIPFTPLPPRYHAEDSIPQVETKEVKQEENPIITTPIQFQFNAQTQHAVTKPKIEIKFKTEFTPSMNETPTQEVSDVSIPKPTYAFKPGQSVQIEYTTKQTIKEVPVVKEPEHPKEPPTLEQVGC